MADSTDRERRLLDRLDRANEENARLRAALEPFAKQADTHGEQIPDHMWIDDYARDMSKPWTSMTGITVGDLRRARAALRPPD